jgi:RNA polymerase sigma-70 factor, ECF subfamily
MSVLPTSEKHRVHPTLAQRLALRDEGALGELYDAYGSTLYSLALAVTGDEPVAESVVAQVFDETWRDAATIHSTRTHLFAHLVSQTRALALARRRPVARDAATWTGFDRQPSDETRQASERAEAPRTSVRSALRGLTDVERRVVGLAFLGGRSVREIAGEMQQSESGVAQHLRSAMDGLRSALSPVAGLLEEQVVTRV